MAQRLVGALVVVFRQKPVKRMLLGAQACPHRAGAVLFQGQMHPFMTTVLLGCPGQMRSGRIPSLTHHSDNAESPPKATEGWSIIGPNGQRQAIQAKSTHKPRADLLRDRGEQPPTEQEITTKAVEHGQRIAVTPIAGAKLSLEIRTPYRIGGSHLYPWLGIRRAPAHPTPGLNRLLKNSIYDAR
jgi:hypothetical protein